MLLGHAHIYELAVILWHPHLTLKLVCECTHMRFAVHLFCLVLST